MEQVKLEHLNFRRQIDYDKYWSKIDQSIHASLLKTRNDKTQISLLSTSDAIITNMQICNKQLTIINKQTQTNK